MLKFTLRRLSAGVFLLAVVCTIAFALLSMGSQNIARSFLGPSASPAKLAEWNHAHDLDEPFLVRYWHWISGAIRGDLGDSWSMSQSVSTLLVQRLSTTLTIVSISVTLTAILAIALGVTAALRGGWLDRVVQVLGLAGFAIPNFMVAFGLVLVFAVQHRIFNATGWVPPRQDFGEFVKSASLPVIALAFGGLASVTQQVRAAVKDMLQQDFVRTLHTRGLPFGRILFRHVLRNAAAPALAILGLQFAGLLGGAVIIEQIFAIPGLGQFSAQTTGARDIPAVMGIVTLAAFIVVLVNLVIEILSALINPKVRLS